MDGMKDGGGFDAAPPPVSGLGNFKGVMLCNRPADEPPSAKAVGGEDGGPFKSMISTTMREQIGLTPCRNFEPTVKTRGPSAALRRHVRWLKELQDQMKEEREQGEEDAQRFEEQKKKIKACFERHRDDVREMLNERSERLRKASKAANEAKARERTGASKPLWAMTEKEKDEFEEDEANELLNFADGLNYDQYIGDLEFRQGVEALKDRAGKLKKEQEAFKDALVQEFNKTAEDDEERSTSAGGSPRSSRLEDGLDGASCLGSDYSAGSRARRRENGERRNADGRPEWDGSTSCGDGPEAVARKARSEAEEILENAPQLKGVHSKGSVSKLIEHAKKSPPTPANLMEAMLQDAAPIPVITASEDTQTRLHKPPDPSCLPYLYRSPAV